MTILIKKSVLQIRQPSIGKVLNFGHPLARNLVGYWPLNDGNGKIITDISGYRHTGTFGTGAWFTSKFGLVPSFDGVTGSINCGSKSVLDNLPVGKFSVACLIYPRTEGEGAAGVALWKDASNVGWRIDFFSTGTNALRLYMHAATGGTDCRRVANNSTILLNSWSSLIVTFAGVWTSASGIKIYINGKEVGYQSTIDGAGSVKDDSGANFHIGADNANTATSDALIANVMVWRNRVLNPTEIKKLYSEPNILLLRNKRNVFFVTVAGGVSSTATPSISLITVLVNAPTVLVSKSSIATPSIASVSVLVDAPTTLISNNATATPAIAISSVIVNIPAILISNSAITTPAVALVTVQVNTAVASVLIIQIASPLLAQVTIIINSPVININNNAIANPDISIISIGINAPIVTIVRHATATAILTTITISLLSPTITIVSVSGIADIIILLSQIEKIINSNSRITKFMNNNSLIEKNILSNSRIEKFINKNSEIEKNIVAKSRLH